MKLPPKLRDLSGDRLREAMLTPSILNCSKMLKKCEALCCHCVPIPRELFERNKSRLKNPDYKIINMGEKLDADGVKKPFILPLTEDLRCPFNDPETFRCNIYDDRPEVCKVYGNGLARCTSCPFFKGNGQKRSKKQRDLMVKMSIEDFEEVAGKISKEIERQMNENKK